MAIVENLLRGAAVSVIALTGAAAYADSQPAVQFEHSLIVRFADLNLDRRGMLPGCTAASLWSPIRCADRGL